MYSKKRFPKIERALFCSKAVDDFINRTTKRAMRIIFNTDNEEALDALLQRWNFDNPKKICKNEWLEYIRRLTA